MRWAPRHRSGSFAQFALVDEFAIEGPEATPLVHWNARAISHMGLDHEKLRYAIAAVAAPEIQERYIRRLPACGASKDR